MTINTMQNGILSSIIIIIVILFKLGAAPVHFWVPQLYSKINIYSLSYLLIVPKVGLTIALIKIISLVCTPTLIAPLSGILENMDFSIADNEDSEIDLFKSSRALEILSLSAVLSMVVGSFLGILSQSIIKILAYSSIGHVGNLLAGIYSIKSITANSVYAFYLFENIYIYLFVYVIMVLNILSIIIVIYNNKNVLQNLTNNNNKNKDPLFLYLNNFINFYKVAPVLSISLAITLFSMAGIPPLSGFMIKYNIYSTVMFTGHYYLAIISVITSIITCYYYLNIIKNTYSNELYTDSIVTKNISSVKLNINYFTAIVISFTLNLNIFIGLIYFSF